MERWTFSEILVGDSDRPLRFLYKLLSLCEPSWVLIRERKKNVMKMEAHGRGNHLICVYKK